VLESMGHQTGDGVDGTWRTSHQGSIALDGRKRVMVAGHFDIHLGDVVRTGGATEPWSDISGFRYIDGKIYEGTVPTKPSACSCRDDASLASA
jgi:hypothetical protein